MVLKRCNTDKAQRMLVLSKLDKDDTKNMFDNMSKEIKLVLGGGPDYRHDWIGQEDTSDDETKEKKDRSSSNLIIIGSSRHIYHFNVGVPEVREAIDSIHTF